MATTAFSKKTLFVIEVGLTLRAEAS